jgi:hypothetical protein
MLPNTTNTHENIHMPFVRRTTSNTTQHTLEKNDYGWHVAPENPRVLINDEYDREDASFSFCPPNSNEEDCEEEYSEDVAEGDVVAKAAIDCNVGMDLKSVEKQHADVPDDDTNKAARKRKTIKRVKEAPISLTALINSQTTMETISDKRRVIELLLDAGLESLDADTIASLPDWADISSLYYSSKKGAIVYGLETCEAFRHSVAVDDAMLGVGASSATIVGVVKNVLSHRLTFFFFCDTNAQPDYLILGPTHSHGHCERMCLCSSMLVGRYPGANIDSYRFETITPLRPKLVSNEPTYFLSSL